jgi:ABC-type transporter Mla MlaB component
VNEPEGNTMSDDYQKQRLEARAQYMRTESDGSRISTALDNGHLVVDMPERLDHLVTTPALKEIRQFQGKVQSMEIRLHKTVYVDSSGLGYLLMLSGLLPSRSIRAKLSGVTHTGVKVPLQVANFHKLFDF